MFLEGSDRADRSRYRRSISTCATDLLRPRACESKGGFMKGIVSSKLHSSCLSDHGAARGSPPRRGKDALAGALLLAGIAAAPVAALADGVNPNCTGESVFYNPGHAEDIV